MTAQALSLGIVAYCLFSVGLGVYRAMERDPDVHHEPGLRTVGTLVVTGIWGAAILFAMAALHALAP